MFIGEAHVVALNDHDERWAKPVRSSVKLEGDRQVMRLTSRPIYASRDNRRQERALGERDDVDACLPGRLTQASLRSTALRNWTVHGHHVHLSLRSSRSVAIRARCFSIPSR